MLKKLLALGLVFALCAADRPDDPLTVASEVYKKLFENEKVRVMEVTFAPGQKIKSHSHPDHVVTVLEPGRLKIYKPDGSSQELDLTAMQVVWIPAETHWAENTGSTRIKLIVSELK